MELDRGSLDACVEIDISSCHNAINVQFSNRCEDSVEIPGITTDNNPQVLSPSGRYTWRVPFEAMQEGPV